MYLYQSIVLYLLLLNVYCKCKLESYVLKRRQAWNGANRKKVFSNTENDQSTRLLVDRKYVQKF